MNDLALLLLDEPSQQPTIKLPERERGGATCIELRRFAGQQLGCGLVGRASHSSSQPSHARTDGKAPRSAGMHTKTI